ncbi:MAG: T9SS type A sorting domain-containing protein, partial [Flavobacteriales bacterium]|nr:T9SS type A sorting domain-containing protein [Flavobacteriales bacterium]
GMEIRGQAFAFATNDEVNNMTFYNCEMINRSTFTLTQTYFGQWVDADLGGFSDDYVGCDASRGLGYCYNGDAVDQSANGVEGYGATPPAVGVDFFEGPYADNDGIDNPLTQNIPAALANNGIPYKGLGIGYGDGIVDNERYGMRKFVYYSIGGGQFNGDGDPSSALDHYNYLRGRWRQGGAQMVWGGNGNSASSGGTVLADLLFPGDSDPLFWSTQGIAASPADWSEFNAQGPSNPNPVGDRRFLQSAGPFTLEPGAVNDLTVGVVWARAISGDNLASIKNLQVADDKAQALFDNCFKIAEGPDAPDVSFQELDREIILYITNKKTSNNYNESYNQKNPFIAIPDTLDGIYYPTDDDKDTLKFYKFQGYQIYQVKNGLITVSELTDPNVSRLAAQVDLKDGVTTLINHIYDEELQVNFPILKVQGKDEGIQHSFRLKNDLFATGDVKLVNHKTYYYMAVAYGYNEFKHFDPNDPLKLDGQRLPYIGSRKMAGGQGIRSFSAIPHNPSPENGGTLANSEYGDMPQITRIEGQGNGGNDLELTASSEASIVANNFMDFPVYKAGKGPIQVKVIDPLNVKAGVYRVQFKDTATSGSLGDAFWTLIPPSSLAPPHNQPVNADQLIAVENEQLILEHGLSISIKQVDNPGVNKLLGNGVIGSSVEYGDSTLKWFSGAPDSDGENDGNWIRSGTDIFDNGAVTSVFNDYDNGNFQDEGSFFENLIQGTWSPYRLVSFYKPESPGEAAMQDAVGLALFNGAAVKGSGLKDISSVDIVFTSDKSKWSRAMVIESRNDAVLAEGGAKHLELRAANSVDKNGNDDGSGTTGLGWFPGYAINVETGERLNIAFAEDSWLAGENGRDMIWNPTSTLSAGINNELMMGGKHYVYVFRKTTTGNPLFPSYDGCATLHTEMASGADIKKMIAFRSCIWAGIPMLEAGHSLLETTAKVKLRVEKPYESYTTSSTFNAGLPLYQFDMTGLEVELGSQTAMDSALALINVVPNPYYAFSLYETGTLDNRIKITNLPEECTISIYNVNGTLMRRFQKGDPKTSLEWDLKNHVNVPVASGVYLIHVKVPDVGERTLKWYGVIKPTDLTGF